MFGSIPDTRRLCDKNCRLFITTSSVTGEFPTQRASDVENVSIWWLHHATRSLAFKLPCGSNSWLMWSSKRSIHCIFWLHLPRTFRIWETTYEDFTNNFNCGFVERFWVTVYMSGMHLVMHFPFKHHCKNHLVWQWTKYVFIYVQPVHIPSFIRLGIDWRGVRQRRAGIQIASKYITYPVWSFMQVNDKSQRVWKDVQIKTV